MDALCRFRDLMESTSPRLDLALAVIAAAGRPEVDADELVVRLDTLAASLPGGGAEDLCRELFAPGGAIALLGDRDDYHDPRNSLLDEVLSRHRGIPITLSVIGMEVGRRLGLELVGIGMPGHFLLGDPAAGRFFDPYDGGQLLDPEGARAVFHRLHGPGQPFEAAYLAASPPRSIVERVLNNLRGSYLQRRDRRGLITTLELSAAVPGSPIAARRELAAALAADGRFLRAAEVHEQLAAEDPATRDADRRAALQLRARLN